MRRALITLVLVMTAIGGLVFAEGRARTELESQFIDMVSSTFPGVRIQRTDVRGQPYLLSKFNQTISTGYAYLEPGIDGSYQVVLVQNLDLRSERTRRISTFVTVPYPDGMPEPELDTTADLSQASFGDQLITYTAELVGSTVVFSTDEHGADRRFTPAPAQLSTVTIAGALPDGARIVRVAAKDDGVLAEIIVEDMALNADR